MSWSVLPTIRSIASPSSSPGQSSAHCKPTSSTSSLPESLGRRQDGLRRTLTDHVWRTKEILGVITLDLFAVLFGGATALLPIYAKDILRVGPAGLGWLTAAVSVGALVASITQGIRRPFRRQGMAFAWSVAGFGVAIIVFGLSSWFWLSLLALIAIGALDNISVVTRQLVVQFYTPDELRGRVSAVNRVFISSSNELGAFESGALAALTGPVFTVVFGGLATIAFVGVGMRYFPALRKLGSLAR